MTQDRQHYDSGTPWESFVGYARAVRVGDRILVSGTTSYALDGTIHAVGDAGEQTRMILRHVDHALRQLGGRLDDVVRTRIYVVNIDDWDVIGAAHGEVFRDIRPACAMVEVRRLAHPDMLVEIEAEAIVVDPMRG